MDSSEAPRGHEAPRRPGPPPPHTGVARALRVAAGIALIAGAIGILLSILSW